MRTTVVTGAASGIGAAVRARLEAAGERVLGVDLRDALTAGKDPAAVAVSSNSSSLTGADNPLVAGCLAGDEDRARRLADELGGHAAYAGAKRALALWVRHNAPAWATAGVRLNAV